MRDGPVESVLDLVERVFDTRLDRVRVVRKRRSLGARTDRGTWVRVERRPPARITTQGWNGTETAQALTGVAKPRWHAGHAWVDQTGAAMWRADETDLVTEAPLRSGGRLTRDPGLGKAWWRTLNSSLNALAVQHTTRVATPDTDIVTPELVTATLRTVFPEIGDTSIDEWTPAHADLNWANITGPGQCRILDWEDWGMAPRGLDAATLWIGSLAVDSLAERVHHERRADLESRSGTLMSLFVCARSVLLQPDTADPLLVPARHVAADLVARTR
ncbi:hypothetical protein [Embleya sp. MST-111070]|uniref:hypothetical protein n=1 Tax=Embleya sp. MST-111070 TaxID=3398231 RepID=UPI003F73B115